jgi:hypothetical protein
MSRAGSLIALLLFAASTGCQSLHNCDDRVYREDCPDCLETQGKVPLLRRWVPLGACRGGCGEVYWGEWRNDPPKCDSCNCGHCAYGQDCSPAPSGPFSALTMRALTGGHCDTPNCCRDRGCDVNPPPSRAVYYHDQHGTYADRSNYDHARTSAAPGSGYATRNQFRPAPMTDHASTATSTPSGARTGIRDYGYAADEKDWDIMGSAGPSRSAQKGQTPMVARRSVAPSRNYPTTEPVTSDPRGSFDTPSSNSRTWR